MKLDHFDHSCGMSLRQSPIDFLIDFDSVYLNSNVNADIFSLGPISSHKTNYGINNSFFFWLLAGGIDIKLIFQGSNEFHNALN